MWCSKAETNSTASQRPLTLTHIGSPWPSAWLIAWFQMVYSCIHSSARIQMEMGLVRVKGRLVWVNLFTHQSQWSRTPGAVASDRWVDPPDHAHRSCSRTVRQSGREPTKSRCPRWSNRFSESFQTLWVRKSCSETTRTMFRNDERHVPKSPIMLLKNVRDVLV